MRSKLKKSYNHSRDIIEVKTKEEVKNSKNLNDKKNQINLKYSYQPENSQNLRYFSKNKTKDQNENESAKKQPNASTSGHIVITSINLDYDKLKKEDESKINDLKTKIVEERLNIEKNKKLLSEKKNKNDVIKENIKKNNLKLQQIKSNQETYKKLNESITTKITELKKSLEEQGNLLRERQTLLRRRETMMNYLLAMLMNARFAPRNDDDYPNVDSMSYEELLALEERMGNVSKGLSEDKIKKLSREIFSKNKFMEDKCIICQYEFEKGEKIVVLPCKHCFHSDCIEEWLKNQKTCPFCKEEIKI